MRGRKSKEEKLSEALKSSKLNDVKAFVAKQSGEYKELLAQRAQINQKISAIRSSVEAYGVSKKAFVDSFKFKEDDALRRRVYDNSYIICRDAMGVPIKDAQLDLFKDAEQEAEFVASDVIEDSVMTNPAKYVQGFSEPVALN